MEKAGIKGYKDIDFVYSYMNVDIDENGKVNGDEVQNFINEFSILFKTQFSLVMKIQELLIWLEMLIKFHCMMMHPPTDPSFRN